jgi:hypothetical protein
MNTTACLRHGRSLVIAASVLSFTSAAAAQGVGAGPLTSGLTDKEPTSGVLKVGPLRLAPGLTIREAGHDDNVFDEAVDPKEDWVIAGTPDLAVFTRLRWVQLSTYFGSEMQYYKTYTTENAIGHDLRGRADILISRVTPFIAAAQKRGRTRPNGEIDVRADLQQNELSGGIAYSLSANASVFASAIETSNDFQDAFEEGVSLDQSLNRKSRNYQAGLSTALTPLLGLQLRGSYGEDDFLNDPSRNGATRNVSAEFRFDAAAVVSGSATIGYSDYVPVDPLVERFRGLSGSGFITYPFLEIGRFNFTYTTGMEYSFDAAEAYYRLNSFGLTYTQRLRGEVDLQGVMTRSYFNYGQREGSPARQDSLESYNGNLGYNLRNRTRISMNYEYARRRSPAFAERNYIRRRVFLSWAVAF